MRYAPHTGELAGDKSVTRWLKLLTIWTDHGDLSRSLQEKFILGLIPSHLDNDFYKRKNTLLQKLLTALPMPDWHTEVLKLPSQRLWATDCVPEAVHQEHFTVGSFKTFIPTRETISSTRTEWHSVTFVEAELSNCCCSQEDHGAGLPVPPYRSAGTKKASPVSPQPPTQQTSRPLCCPSCLTPWNAIPSQLPHLTQQLITVQVSWAVEGLYRTALSS